VCSVEGLWVVGLVAGLRVGCRAADPQHDETAGIVGLDIREAQVVPGFADAHRWGPLRRARDVQALEHQHVVERPPDEGAAVRQDADMRRRSYRRYAVAR